MAAGTAIGLLSICERESMSDSPGTSCSGHASRLPRVFAPQKPSSSQPAHGEDDRYFDRPRLPSISNFLDVISRPEFAQQTRHGTLPLPKYESRPQLVVPLATHQPRSSDGISRQSLLPPFERSNQSSQQAGPGAHRNSHDWQHRSSITAPSLPHSDARSSISYSVPTPSSRHTSITLLQTPAALSDTNENINSGQTRPYVFDSAPYQKMSNSDTVNPKWGITKAGKPRKRLGQACNTCREKKIKCDPSFPKCTQCQRFGRECKFEAPRHNSSGSKLPPRTQSPFSDTFEDSAINHRRSSVALTEGSSYSDSSPARVCQQNSQHMSQCDSQVSAQQVHTADQSKSSKRIKLREQTAFHPDVTPMVAISDGREGQFSPAWWDITSDTDPYAVDSKLTQHYLKAYFTVTSAAGTSLFPEKLFMDWIKKEKHKSSDENLVIYSMLAAGCRYTRNPDRGNHETIFSKIAYEGVTQAIGQFSIQLIHARLMMCMLEFQVGSEAKAWDLGGAAMRAAYAMGMNTEHGISDICQKQQTLYGLETGRAAECLRRTFLLAYILDRFAVSCAGYAPTFNGADLLLHLPCTDNAFERGHIPKTSIFDGEDGVTEISAKDELAKLSSFAFLVQIASLSCNAHILATRVRYQGSDQRRERYAMMRGRLEEQLRCWDESYTSYLKLALPRAQANGTSSPPQPLGGLQIIMHHVYMVLYRYGHHRSMSQHQIAQRVRQAYDSARSCLGIAQRLASITYQDIQDHHIAATNAVFGYAIVEAVDILTAGGLNADFWGNESRMMGLMMNGAVPLLDGLAERWKSAKTQRGIVSLRTKSLFNAVHVGPSQTKVAFLMAEPMVHAFSRDEDIVYGIDRLRYFSIMDWHHVVHNKSSVIEISDTR